MWELRVPRPAITLLAFLAIGCASVAPELQSSRVLRARPFSGVFATALDALADLGAQPVTARPREDGGVLKALVRTAGPPPGMFVLEVTVVASGEEVRVAVTVEPAEAERSPLDDLVAATGEAASRSGCGCPAQEPSGPDPRPRDNLGALSQSRRLVRAYLAILDGRLR